MITRNASHRKIKLNHSGMIPRYIVSFDTETQREQDKFARNRFRHRLRLGVAHYARIVDLKPVGLKARRFGVAEGFWRLLDEITKPNYTTWVVGHNTLFDLIMVDMPEVFERADYVVDWPRSKRKREDNSPDNPHCWTYCVIDEPITIIAVRNVKTNGRVVFVDLMNWFAIPLAEIGQSLGLPKMKMPDWKDSDNAWFDYCERDSEITFRAFVNLISWVKENDFGMFKYTAPSQAMAAFRHKFMKSPIFTHEAEPIRKLERDSFCGGRTECWRLGEINELAFQYDVNSLYPYVMQNAEFPFVLNRYEQREAVSSDIPNIDYSRATAVVEIESKSANYPMRTPAGVIYPVGRFETTLCGRELENAFYRNEVKAVGTWAEYRTAPLFKLFVDELWELRRKYKESGDTLYSLFVKYLMNSLFGKFAQRSAPWENIPDIMPNLPWSAWCEVNVGTGTVEKFRSFGYQVQKQCERQEKAGTFIAISAFVASAGRVLMNEYRRLAGNENVYYQGVDSLIVNKAGQEKLAIAGLLDDDAIGKFKLQIACETGTIHGTADYVVGERCVIAGRPLRQAASDRERDLIRRFDVRGGLFNGSAESCILEQLQEWKRSGNYWKGIVADDGTVSPIQLG